MNIDKHKAFTLIEVLLSMGLVVILTGALLTGGKYLKTRAEQQLTRGTIAIIGVALEQYYEQVKQFPPQIDSEADMKNALFGTAPSTITIRSGNHPDPADSDPMKAQIAKAFWRSEAAFYYLTKVSQSKSMLDSLAARMISNKDLAGMNLQFEIPSNSGTIIDWVRFVDAWGTSLDYVYKSEYAFPVIKSAGPDKIFGTDDDLSSQ